MRVRSMLFLSAALAASVPGAAGAQEAGQASAQGTPADPQTDPAGPADPAGSDIVVTARQREERLQDVPVAVTAVSGDAIKQQQLVQVRDVAAYTPGLNINSDSAGRAFVSIRGIGTTVIDTVQPGVGIFIDGVYQPNTTYLNSPLVDVARVEVLRGPQGTLFGNNTLGGAINVITRQPGNEWEGRIDGSLAGGDNFASASASLSGPVVRDVLAVRVGGAYHTQDGFVDNPLAGGPNNPLETKSVSTTLRFTPSPAVTLTVNGNYDRVFGGSVPYQRVTGPRDFSLVNNTNQRSLVTIDYYGLNAKGEFRIDALHTTLTAIGAYNQSDAASSADGDFSAIDFLRATNDRSLKTRTGELRADTRWSSSISTLIGAFYSRYTSEQNVTSTLVPLNLTIPARGDTRNENYALFGTVFIAFDPTLDLAAGIRFDHQRLDASTTSAGGTLARYRADEWQPRVTLTKRWSRDFMTYGSVARGARGGGQNEPSAPNQLYRGDSVWTYEVGAKASALNGRVTANVAAFYNDYKDFIGPNALAPNQNGPGFVAVNLNAGDVESYGLEAELSVRPVDDWRLYANATLLHARVTDATQFRQTTGYAYPGDRIPFVPDANYTVGSNVRLPFLRDQALVADANVVVKGERAGMSLDEASVPIMPRYYLVNGSLAWNSGPLEVAVFATNLFDEKYQETFLDASLLSRAGVPVFLVSDIAIQGNRRRVGLRGTIRF